MEVQEEKSKLPLYYERYLALEEKYPEAIVIQQMGDFYEVMGKNPQEASNIIFYSCNGVYEYDDITGISKVMKKCNINFKIDNLIEEKSYEHISINIFKKNIRKDIPFSKFFEMVDENKFRIYLDFYSCFAQGLLIKGYCKKSEIELFITEINDVQFTFD